MKIPHGINVILKPQALQHGRLSLNMKVDTPIFMEQYGNVENLLKMGPKAATWDRKAYIDSSGSLSEDSNNCFVTSTSSVTSSCSS